MGPISTELVGFPYRSTFALPRKRLSATATLHVVMGRERTLCRSTAIFYRSLYFLRYGSEYVVSGQRTADTLERKLTHRLDRDGILNCHQHARD